MSIKLNNYKYWVSQAMVHYGWYDLVGLVGVGVTILAYFLLQTGALKQNGLDYLLYNLFGAVMIVISLLYHWNLASFVIEVLWILISVFGILKLAIAPKLKNKRHL